ncbi:hypothetical protein K1W54_02005 [Micromonospora sp. CPCC 205371]|nr:hypothetical protein [Micromonospora sp. CPCC 205371]
MASARRDGVPAVLRGEVRLRVWVVVISGTLAAILLAYFGHRAYVETAAYSAHRNGTLALEPAEVVEINYFSGTGGYGGGNSQEVRFRLHSGGERTSLLKDRKAYLDVDEGQTVRVGMWHGHLVAVEDKYVRTPWTPGASMVFLPLPPAFVLMVLQVYRLWRLRKEGPKYVFGYNSSGAYATAAALLAFGTALVALSFDRVPWLSVLAFAVSALGPLAWFTLREIRERRTAPRG